MSYPAVLYDHNPSDIHNNDDVYFVSKMFRRISAPPAPRFQVLEGEESDNNYDKDDNQADDIKEENKTSCCRQNKPSETSIDRTKETDFTRRQ